MNQDAFRDYVLDQLHLLGPVQARPMFGGYGLYHQGVFFAIIAGGRLYYKTDEASRVDYEAHGMEPFRPSERQTLKSYYEVPDQILDDHERLAEWARRAMAAQTGSDSAPA